MDWDKIINEADDRGGRGAPERAADFKDSLMDLVGTYAEISSGESESNCTFMVSTIEAMSKTTPEFLPAFKAALLSNLETLLHGEAEETFQNSIEKLEKTAPGFINNKLLLKSTLVKIDKAKADHEKCREEIEACIGEMKESEEFTKEDYQKVSGLISRYSQEASLIRLTKDIMGVGKPDEDYKRAQQPTQRTPGTEVPSEAFRMPGGYKGDKEGIMKFSTVYPATTVFFGETFTDSDAEKFLGEWSKEVTDD